MNAKDLAELLLQNPHLNVVIEDSEWGIDTVRRYRGNKLFKVKDPRGLVFEITVASMFEILQDGVVEKGIIKSPCIWKTNKNLIVVE